MVCGLFSQNTGGGGIPRAVRDSSAVQIARPLFSWSYKLLFPQALCFYNHLNCPGVWGSWPPEGGRYTLSSPWLREQRGRTLYQSIIAPPPEDLHNVSTMDIQGKAKLVAIVDDDDSVRSAVKGLLKSAELPAQSFASAEEFLKSGQHRQAACLITDIRMPGMSGLELQAKLIAERCRIPIIFITAHGDEKMRLQALRAGAVEFLAKPFDEDALLESVRAALETGPSK